MMLRRAGRWALLCLVTMLAAAREAQAFGLPSLLSDAGSVVGSTVESARALPKLTGVVRSAVESARALPERAGAADAQGGAAAEAGKGGEVRAPVLPWVLPVPTAERTDPGTFVQSEVDSLKATGAGPVALADVVGVADAATGGGATKSLANLVGKTFNATHDVLPASFLNPLADVLTLGGSPLLTKGLPAPTFEVVGGGDQNKATREDPYQDISKRAKAAHAPSGALASAAGAAATRASHAAAFAAPDAVRTHAYGSNFVPALNVFLTTLVRMLVDV